MDHFFKPCPHCGHSGNNKKKAKDATIEELIADVTHWEDIDTSIIIISGDEDGTSVEVMNYDGRRNASGATLKEALIAYGKEKHKGFSEYAEFDYE